MRRRGRACSYRGSRPGAQRGCSTSSTQCPPDHDAIDAGRPAERPSHALRSGRAGGADMRSPAHARADAFVARLHHLVNTAIGAPTPRRARMEPAPAHPHHLPRGGYLARRRTAERNVIAVQLVTVPKDMTLRRGSMASPRLEQNGEVKLRTCLARFAHCC